MMRQVIVGRSVPGVATSRVKIIYMYLKESQKAMSIVAAVAFVRQGAVLVLYDAKMG